MSESIEADTIKAFIVEKSPLSLKVIDQSLLPYKLEYVQVSNVQDGYQVIKNMLVRGAPCIAAVGCLSIVVELNSFNLNPSEDLVGWLKNKSEFLVSSRPTAVNLKHSLEKMIEYACRIRSGDRVTSIHKLTELCLSAIDIGMQANERLDDFGAREIFKQNPEQKLTILTHCNTGSLATVGHGTALGVIRSLWNKNNLNRAYCTETRPYNQGSRLTAWELVQESIPATLIVDNMVAYLMEKHKIHAVLVGADRVTRNGDTANKIGTLQLAIVANHYQVPFYVAAPTQSLDLETPSGLDIKVEQRPGEELRYIGNLQLAPDNVDVWNPCFDVTPAHLITGIITEFGVCKTNEIESFLNNKEREKGDVALF